MTATRAEIGIARSEHPATRNPQTGDDASASLRENSVVPRIPLAIGLVATLTATAIATTLPVGASGSSTLPTTGRAILVSIRLPTPAHTEVGSVTIKKARYTFRVAATPTRSLVRIQQGRMTFWLAVHQQAKKGKIDAWCLRAPKLGTRCHKGGNVTGPYLRQIQIYFFALNPDTFVKVVGADAIDHAHVTRSTESGLPSACMSGTVASGPYRACVAANHFGTLNYAAVTTHLAAYHRGVTKRDFRLPAPVRR